MPTPNILIILADDIGVEPQLHPDGITARSPGTSAAASDGKYKLNCMTLTAGPGQDTYLVDEQGAKTKTPVYSYQLTYLNPEPGIVGSLIETPIPALNSNPTSPSRSAIWPIRTKPSNSIPCWTASVRTTIPIAAFRSSRSRRSCSCGVARQARPHRERGDQALPVLGWKCVFGRSPCGPPHPRSAAAAHR